jgi:SAM-dependent MidA family methyltransferase
MSYSDLHQMIIDRIRREEPISFAQYMRMALYEPGYGYYMTGAAKMGWEADYFTSTDVSGLFANCMGRQLFEMWEKLKRPAHFIVLEQGAGRGHLAEGVRSWAQKVVPEFYEVLDYRAEDIRGGQDAAATGERSDTVGYPIVMVSNELVDAFPVHVVEKRGERLYEVFVDVQEGRLREVLDEPGTDAVASYLDMYEIPWRTFEDGWRAEINLDALRWMQRTAGLVRRGFILTIDYGDKSRALYTAWRKRGTLLCFYKHQANERPLLHPGEQDITAHVNFSSLIDEGRRLGMRLHRFTTQRRWLQSMGIEEELEQRRVTEFAEADTARATDRGQVALLKWRDLRQRAAVLTDPGGMGDFKVLIMRR